MIKIGIKNRRETVSTQENSAERLGSGNVPVFATISMIGLMEKTCPEIDRRRLIFRVAAYDEVGLIGEGTHERFIIDKERFISKTYSQ